MSSQRGAHKPAAPRRRSAPDDDAAEQPRLRFAHVSADIRPLGPADHARTGRFGAQPARGCPGGWITPIWSIAVRSSRVAQCSQSFPPAIRYQWLCSATKRLLVGGAKPPSLPKVGARGADADGDHVGVGDDRFNRHLEVGELCPQPTDHLPGVRRTLDRTRLLPAERLPACSRNSSAMMSSAALRFLVVKTSLNSRMTRALLSCDNPFPPYKEARYS
jgi:hypothetical protein